MVRVGARWVRAWVRVWVRRGAAAGRLVRRGWALGAARLGAWCGAAGRLLDDEDDGAEHALLVVPGRRAGVLVDVEGDHGAAVPIEAVDVDEAARELAREERRGDVVD
eukprot:1436842-Prymnesium_polylepis.1